MSPLKVYRYPRGFGEIFDHTYPCARARGTTNSEGEIRLSCVFLRKSLPEPRDYTAWWSLTIQRPRRFRTIRRQIWIRDSGVLINPFRPLILHTHRK